MNWVPFCSLRCKQIDMARWIDGDYLITRPLEPDDLESLEEDENDRPLS